MSLLAGVLLAVVALLHVGFLVLEMFLFTTPRGRAVFGTSAEEAATMAVLAANQGLYNGFLAAGLAYGLVTGDLGARVLFLVFVLVAGLYGAATVSRRILVVQAVPAALALAAVLAAR